MTGLQAGAHLVLGWADQALELRVEVGEDGVARLAGLVPRAARASSSPRGPEAQGAVAGAGARLGLPLVDVITADSGRAWSGRRYVESATGGRLRYTSHQERSDGPWHELRVTLADPVTGLRAEAVYRLLEDGGALQSRVVLTNAGSQPVVVESVTSFVGSGLAGPGGALGDVELWWAANDWLGEGRWQSRPLRDCLPDLGRSQHGADPRGRVGLTSFGSWSSGTYLPMGAAVNRATGHAWVWQLEHNGAWHWQVGEHTAHDAGLPPPGHRGGAPTDAYLALLGPTEQEHQWRLVLQPGESFESVPAGMALSNEGFEAALARLTAYRRALRRPHDDHRRLPVIFNDYMNTLMGDPTTERLLPLVDAAARAGAEYFCIDSGWYNELGENWWDTVGVWAPSSSRFPKGITEVLDHIRAAGMVPGLWLEPEVVGVRSPVAAKLPAEAFFCRGGQRVVEQGRYHLDLTHPAAVEHLDRVVDFLVGDLGVGYLKMDYNVNVGPGTEAQGTSAGAGLLAHNRAFCQWAERLLDRHPGLTLESCASGGMRTDYALLSCFQLQSTSDQQDFLRYPPIAAAAPAAIAPEQAAIWAYPQPGWADNEITFALCGALLGRVHLSGHLDRMGPGQQLLVAEAVDVYKKLRPDLPEAFPFWPLGLPGWSDPWVALGLRARASTYVLVWHRGGVVEAPAGQSPPDRDEAVLAVPHLKGQRTQVEVLYPARGCERPTWEPGTGQLAVALPEAPAACLAVLRPL